jgi:chromate transporter
MTTPALLIIPLVHFAGRKLENPRVKTILQTIIIASSGLLLVFTARTAE